MSRYASYSRPFALLLVVIGLILPRPALADERGFASGLGGVTFGTVTSSDVAGRAGVNVSKHIAIFGEAGRMANVLPKTDNAAINDNASVLAESMAGIPVVLGHVPVAYGQGGVRLNARTVRLVTPFAEASVGVARVTDHLTATVSGTDVTSQVLTTTLTRQLPQTDPLLSFSGGIGIAAGRRTALDLGYRYSRLFATGQGINTGSLFGAVRVGF